MASSVTPAAGVSNSERIATILLSKLGEVVFPKNATFDQDVTLADLKLADNPTGTFLDKLITMLEMAPAGPGIAAANTFRLMGDPGTGKSSVIRWLGKILEIPVVVIDAPNMAPEDMAMPIPVKTILPDGTTDLRLTYRLYDELMRPEPYILVVEEPNRGTKEIRNQLLELIQSRRLADQPLNIAAAFVCDNNAAEDGATNSADMALADRWYCTAVTQAETPWRYALATTFKDVNLTDVFKLYDGLTKEVRKTLSPRTLEHVIWNVLNGNPAEWGIGMIASHRPQLIDGSGDRPVNKTKEILDRITRALGGDPDRRPGNGLMRILDLATTHKVNAYIEGAPGIGKTAFSTAYLRQLGYDVLVLSAPVTSPENMAMPIPTADGRIAMMLHEWFVKPVEGKGKVLILDEVWRAAPATRHRIMSLIHERTLGGRETVGLVSVIALNNPREVNGYKLDVGKPDRAQADRFHMSVGISPNDVPWADHLIRTYGEVGEILVEWHKEHLSSDPAAQTFVTARTLQRMAEFVSLNKPLAWLSDTLMHLDDGPVAIPLHALKELLAKREPLALQVVLRRADEYISRMQSNPMEQAHGEASNAFAAAELSQLERYRDQILPIVTAMNPQSLLVLVRHKDSKTGGATSSFWMKIIQEAKPKVK
jgi:MoxR-like ATPase